MNEMKKEEVDWKCGLEFGMTSQNEHYAASVSMCTHNRLIEAHAGLTSF